MSHVGPLTLTQKRMLALQNGTASAVQLPHTLLPAVHDHSSSSSPHTAVDSQPLIAFGDVEMHDASAPASTAASPPSNYVSIPCASHGHQLIFPVTNSLTRVPSLPSLLTPNLLCLLEMSTPPLPPCLLRSSLQPRDLLRIV